MTFKQLQRLVKQGESEILEFKKSTANLSAAMETHNPNRWESLTNNYKVSDLDATRIKEVIHLGVAHRRIPAEAKKLSVIDMLMKLKLIEHGKLTNAAVILFAKSEKEFIQSNLKLARFRGIDKKSFLDHKFFTGNAFDLYDKAMDYLHFHLPVAAHIESGKSERVETPAIPYSVLREAVTNALVHRDYSFAGGSMAIARYDDRVEIENTGSLLSGISIKQLDKKHPSVLRNSLIAHVFFICGKIEKWGRGTTDMINDSKNVENPLPIYEEIGNNFSVTLPLKHVVPSIIFMPQEHQFVPKLTDRQHKILESLKSGALTRQQIEDTIAMKVLLRELLTLQGISLLKVTGKGQQALWQLI